MEEFDEGHTLIFVHADTIKDIYGKERVAAIGMSCNEM